MGKLDIFGANTEANSLTRRKLVTQIGGAALAMTLLGGCGGSDDDDDNSGGGSGNTGASATRDAQILNFALNLEYLESEFYTYATTGAGIEAQGIGVTGVGTLGPVTGGKRTTFTTPGYEAIALEIAEDERQHVTLLRGALGSAAVARPAINLDALAAAGIDYSTEAGYLALARAFEDVGVTAYLGAAPLLQSKDILAVAGAILAVEALHTGSLRLQVVATGANPGAPLDSKDIPPTTSAYFANNAQALAFARTPIEVLRIVYAAPTATTPPPGGFFPAGANGNFSTLLSL